MYRLILFFSVLLVSQSSLGDLEGTIQTGRPGQAIGAGTVPVGVFQIQSGYDFQTVESGAEKQTNRTLNNILRLGLTERFEVSSILDYSSNEVDRAGMVSDQSGFSQFQLGFRYNLLPNSEELWLPMLALQTRFRLKQVSSEFKPNEVAPVFLLSMTKNFLRSWSFAVNYGLAYNGADPAPTYNYVFSLSHSLSELWSAVFEVYGNEAFEVKNTYFGGGFGVLLSDNLQIDLYVSHGNNRGIEELYGSVGFSWRTIAIDSLFGH